MLQEDQPTGYCIGAITLDLAQRQVRRRDEILPCGKLTFELLALLAEHAPRVVSREMLAERLWGGRYVSPATIKRRIALLRLTLGDHASDPTYIKVVRGQGYALIPAVEPSRVRPVKPAGGLRFALVTGALALTAFVVGTEIGYQDGLEPRIPDLQGSASIFVTSWPYELPQADYSFVAATAQQFLNVIDTSDFIGRLNRAGASADVVARDSLTVVANATSNDLDSLYVTLALLTDSRPDHRESRAQELAAWTRVLQDSRSADSAQLLQPFGHTLRPATATQYRVHVLPLAQVNEGNFLLVANFDFDRAEVQAHPRAIQSDAALSVALAINEQVPQFERAGSR